MDVTLFKVAHIYDVSRVKETLLLLVFDNIECVCGHWIKEGRGLFWRMRKRKKEKESKHLPWSRQS